MIGIIVDITDSESPKKEDRPVIKKKIVTVAFSNNESAAIEFTGKLLEVVSRGFKVKDSVRVEYVMKAHQNRRGKSFNNIIGTSINRI